MDLLPTAKVIVSSDKQTWRKHTPKGKLSGNVTLIGGNNPPAQWKNTVPQRQTRQDDDHEQIKLETFHICVFYTEQNPKRTAAEYTLWPKYMWAAGVSSRIKSSIQVQVWTFPDTTTHLGGKGGLAALSRLALCGI